MSDNRINEIEQEEQGRLEQMVAEALLRDCNQAPDADAEWQKLAARMSVNVDSVAEEETSARRFPLHRTLWIAVGAAAAVALVAVLFLGKDFFHTNRSAIYQPRQNLRI